MKLNAERHLIYTALKTELNYTILQPVIYHHNIHVDVLKFNAVNGLNSKLAYIDEYDVAEVASKILREDNHQFVTYQLCETD